MYDKKWKLFDEDYINNDAPTPLSGQFLLVHHLAQILKSEVDWSPKMLIIEGTKTSEQLAAIKLAFKNAKIQL